jgi:hypothetical protein
MTRTCPNCKSADVRRCPAVPVAEAARSRFRSRFRCRDCNEYFWVMSRRSYRLIGFFVRVNAALLALATALFVVYRS